MLGCFGDANLVRLEEAFTNSALHERPVQCIVIKLKTLNLNMFDANIKEELDFN